jgi:hypothetical protein
MRILELPLWDHGTTHLLSLSCAKGVVVISYDIGKKYPLRMRCQGETFEELAANPLGL